MMFTVRLVRDIKAEGVQLPSWLPSWKNGRSWEKKTSLPSWKVTKLKSYQVEEFVGKKFRYQVGYQVGKDGRLKNKFVTNLRQ